eukprot:m.148052 g.148052  ORF g.148052 m.148052 type:complete len:64 (-) comp14167_c0_seq13:5267-5458(-)
MVMKSSLPLIITVHGQFVFFNTHGDTNGSTKARHMLDIVFHAFWLTKGIPEATIQLIHVMASL